MTGSDGLTSSIKGAVVTARLGPVSMKTDFAIVFRG
jgi:hypothetical protein